MKGKKQKVLSVQEADRSNLMMLAIMNARDFLWAYQVLQKHNNDCIITGAPFVFNSTVANLAFAIELFLKALLYGSGKKVDGHNMARLFEHLPQQTQVEIKNDFNNYLIKKIGHSRDIFGISFENRLKQYSTLYQRWRYIHENDPGTFNSQFIDSFADVLNEIAEKKIQQLLVERARLGC